MDIYIKLKDYDNANPSQSLKVAAQEIEALNVLCTALLVNGPIATNPDSSDLEGFIGNVNTVPNEFGYVTVRITNYESFEWEVMPTSFVVVSGYPRRGENNSIVPGTFI